MLTGGIANTVAWRHLGLSWTELGQAQSSRLWLVSLLGGDLNRCSSGVSELGDQAWLLRGQAMLVNGATSMHARSSQGDTAAYEADQALAGVEQPRHCRRCWLPSFRGTLARTRPSALDARPSPGASGMRR
jgi:hypothetical protein